MRYRIGAAVLLVLAALPARRATATDTQREAASYVVDRWTVHDGLPQNSVVDIAQTPDGYLWLATHDGLARFDGVSFTVFTRKNTPALRSNRVTALKKGPDGGLWVGTTGGLVRYRNGHFTSLADSSARLSGHIHSLAAGPSGGLWIVSGGNVVHYANGTFDRISRYPNLRPGLIKDPYVDREGRLWILYSSVVARLAKERLHFFTSEEGLPKGENLAYLSENADGEIRVATESGRLFGFRNGRFEEAQDLKMSSREGARTYLFEQKRSGQKRSGQIWAAYGGGVSAYRDGREVYRLEQEEKRDYPVKVFYEDRDGNIWAGTEGGGLLRLRRPLFRVYDSSDGLSYDVTLSLAQTLDGSLWVGTNCQGLNRLRGGRFRKYTGPHVPPDACLYAVLPDSQGGLWAGHEDLVHIREDGTSTRYELPYDTTRRPRRGDAVKALYKDPARPGVLWVGAIDGLYRFEDGAVQRHYTPADGLLTRGVRYILRARQSGALWLSTRDGLSRLEDGRFTNFTPENSGFPSRNPRALWEGPDGALWIGTYGDGLVRYDDGQFTAVTKADGLFDDVVSAIVPDGRGNLWMSGNRGIFRVRREALDAFADGRRARVRSVGYGEGAGLKNSETNGGFQPAAWKDRRGRIWFPTLQGVAVVDPAERKARSAPPPAHVEQVLYQDEAVALSGTQNRLPKGRRSFEIRYTGVNLSKPKAVRFRYKLAGFDDGWRTAGQRRQAFYTNVPPGDYRFQVQAAGPAGGSWSDSAVMRLRVPPFFYETTWFWLLCGLLIVGALGGGYGARVYALRRREERLQRRVDEQTEALAREKETTERQARKLAELDEAKNRFFANVTHEFRTPLTLILGPLERMEDGELGTLPTQAEEFVPLMLRNGRRLMRLVEQLLGLARLESGALTLDARWGDLASFAASIVARFQPLAEREDLTLDASLPDAPCRLSFDADKMEHVLSNLLSNAIKFTPKGGAIRVQLTREKDRARLAVSDTGVGLSEEAQAHIFDRFFQVEDSSRRRREGAGIGLALVRELVDLHDGSIGVESAPGEGSTFSVQLPLRKRERGGREERRRGEGEGSTREVHSGGDSQAGTEPPLIADKPIADKPIADKPIADKPIADKPIADKPIADKPIADKPIADKPVAGATSSAETEAPEDDPPPSEIHNPKPNVLVVDDNADVRAYLASLLDGAYRVLEAAHGAQGLEAAREHLPDLILADVMMPVMDGREMTRALKAEAATACIPVLMLTAKAGSEHAVRGLVEGAEDYITKPFDADVLRAKMQATLKARRRLRDRLLEEKTPEETPTAEASGEPARSAFEQEARAVAREHLADADFTVEQWAAEVALSRSRLTEKLKDEAGATPSRLLRRLRLERAEELLREEAGSVSEVAYAVGFNSLSYFSRCFKKHYGAPPSTLLKAKTR